MKKRIITLGLACLLLLAVFAGCAPAAPAQPAASGQGGGADQSAPDTGKKITVLLPKHEMDDIGFMEKETRNFEKETGIKVELINMSWDNVADRVTTELTAGGGSYDVIEFDNSWVAKFIANDWVEPLDQYVTDEMRQGILPGLLEKFSYNGSIYGIAWNNDTRFFMYNSKMLKDAGIAAPPKTWQELNEQSKLLQEKNIAKYGYIDSYMQAQSGTNELTFLVYSFGGRFFDENNKPVIDTDPGVRAAYEYLVDALNTSKVVDPASLTSDYETINNVFNMGSTAFYVQAWPGVYSTANDPENSQIVDQIAVADYSLSGDGKTQAVLTLPEAMAIPKTSKNKDEAWQYIQYMSSKEFDKRKAQEIGALPIWSDLFADPDLLEIYPYWSSFGKQALNAKGHVDLLWFDEFSNMLQIESQKILLGEVSIDEGLKQLQAQCVKLAG